VTTVEKVERKLEVRTFSFELEGMERLRRSEGGDGRLVTGIAVPYGVDQQINAQLIERFDMGAYAHQLRAMFRVQFMLEHWAQGGQPIGRIVEAEEVNKGLRVQMRVSQIDRGDEALTLINDEVLNELSVGFYALKSRMDGNVTVRTKANLTEVALVTRGAYGAGARVTGVRSAGEEQDNRNAARQALARLPLPDMIA